MEDARLMEPGHTDRISIWSIVERHHLLFAVGFVVFWVFGTVVLVKHSLCEVGFWSVALGVIQGLGTVTLSAISLPFAILKGVETVMTLYEAARARRERERAERERQAREEERAAIKEYIESQGEYLSPQKAIEFLNQREAEAAEK